MQGVSRRISNYEQKTRDRVLSDDEIRLVWHEKHHHAALLRFLLLTGLRVGEAQRGHRNGERWIVSARLAKNGREHWVYLTRIAIAQLAAGPFATSPTAVQAWLRRWCDRQGITPRFTPHDTRRSYSTRANEIGIAPHVVERCLNHKLQGVVGTYNRAEHESERIACAKALEQHFLEIVASG